MDWSDATEWHPVNSDVTLNSDHEVNDLPQHNAATKNTNRASKKKLSNPVVNKFVFIDPQSTEMETRCLK